MRPTRRPGRTPSPRPPHADGPRDDEDTLLEIDIAALNARGDGVATWRGRDVIVPFTLPGERVRARIRRQRAGVIDATVVEIVRPSPHRVAPRCRHFGEANGAVGPCGGCQWQHVDYREQLRLKAALVDDRVRAAVPGAPAARETIPGAPPSAPWGFRHKVHFVFGNAETRSRRQGALVMGHYARGSRRVIPIRECPVHDERGNAIAFALEDVYSGAQITAADADGRGVLRSVAIRVGAGTGEVGATLVVTSDKDKRLRTATRWALEHDAPPTAFHLNIHPADDGYVFGDRTRRLAGAERVREVVADTAFLLSPTAFFQTNALAAATLVRLVMEAVPAEASVLDLYAGVGLFALPLARAGHTVVAIEENGDAVRDGEASARLNRLPPKRVRFIARDVETGLRSIRGAEIVVLDPPRDGCSPEVLDDVFGRLEPDRAIYVSCNPDALERDLHAIVRYGYRLASVQPVDMFPHTAHVETVVVLDRE